MLRETPRSSEQRSQPLQESKHLEPEEGSRSSQEIYISKICILQSIRFDTNYWRVDLTEGSRDLELNGPSRCINQQMKEQEDDDMKEPGESTKPSNEGKEAGREKDQSVKEELEDPAEQDMP